MYGMLHNPDPEISLFLADLLNLALHYKDLHFEIKFGEYQLLKSGVIQNILSFVFWKIYETTKKHLKPNFRLKNNKTLLNYTALNYFHIPTYISLKLKINKSSLCKR